MANAASDGGRLTFRRHDRSVLNAPRTTFSSAVMCSGSWAVRVDALEAAGLSADGWPRHRHWTESEIVEAIANWLEESDDHRLVAYRDAARLDAPLPPMPAITRRCGGWKPARTQALAFLNACSPLA